MKTLRTTLTTTIGALALASAAAGCGTSPTVADAGQRPHGDDHDHAAHADAHADLAAANVDDPYFEASLDELTTLSDLVLVGRVTRVEDGVRIGTDPATSYTVVTVEVGQLLKAMSRSGASVKQVKVALLSRIGGSPFVIKGRPIPKVGDRALYLLKKIAPEFNLDGYVLTNIGSLLPVTGTVIESSSEAVAAQEAGLLGQLNKVIQEIEGD